MKKTKCSNKNYSRLAAVALGVVIASVLTMLIALLTSLCIFNEYIEFKASNFVVMIGQFMCAFAGALAAGVAASEGKLFVACTASGGYYFIILCAGILCFDDVGVSALWSLLSCLAGCIAGVFVCFRLKTAVIAKRKRRHIR